MAVRDACMAICWYTFRLYQPTDTKRLALESGKEAKSGSLHSAAAVVNTIVQRYEGDVNQMLRTLMSCILVNLTHLQRLDEINTGRSNIIAEAYNKLDDQVHLIEVATFAHNPRVFRQHLLFVMFVFLVLWIPYLMWLTLSWKLTVIFYPILMFLLSGPFLYRSFLGESFANNNRGNLMNHNEQRMVVVREISELYHPEKSPLRDIVAAAPTHA